MSRQASEPPTRNHTWIVRLVVGVVTVVFDDCDLEEHVGNRRTVPTKRFLEKRIFFDDSATDKREGKAPHRGLHHLGLTVVLALSAFLNLSWLTSEGYANVYYAATVKNMLASWHNFFFASFDAGFVSVDKPPLGFWIQAASAYVFGFHRWSLLLPQALTGVLCVALLHSRQSPDGALSSGEIDQPQLQRLDYGILLVIDQ